MEEGLQFLDRMTWECLKVVSSEQCNGLGEEHSRKREKQEQKP